MVLEMEAADPNMQARLELLAARIATSLLNRATPTAAIFTSTEASEEDKAQPFNYTRSRDIHRPQPQDIIAQVSQTHPPYQFLLQEYFAGV